MLLELGILLGVIVLLYLLAIMPKLRKNPMLERFDGYYYAHRGIHDNKTNTPENSLKAFELAVKGGYGIELDVQITKDLVPVVFHDFDLNRACGVNKKVAELEYKDLLEYRLFDSLEKIPTLYDAMELVAGKVPLIIELKIPLKPHDTCIAVSEVLKNYKGLYCIESFNPLGLGWYKKRYPWIIRGQLSTDFIKEKKEGSRVHFFFLKHFFFNFYTKPDFIAYQHKYKKALSFTICRRLYKTMAVAWTIKSQRELDENKDYFDLFIFENFLPKE